MYTNLVNNIPDDVQVEMNHSLSFSKVKFKWDHKNNAYVANGPLWISNVNDIAMNQIVDGLIIIEKGINTDVLQIYFETFQRQLYLFEFKNGVMLSWSTLDSFYNKLIDIPDFRMKCPRTIFYVPFSSVSVPGKEWAVCWIPTRQ